MAGKKNPLEGAQFTRMAADIEETTLRLCDETYAATTDPVPEARLRELVARARAHIERYESLLAAYTGGRLAAIRSAGEQIGPLKEFTGRLERKLEKKG